MTGQMPMEAKCCENAMKVAEERITKKMVDALKPTLAALPADTRKAAIKQLVTIGPGFAELIDLLQG